MIKSKKYPHFLYLIFLIFILFIYLAAKEIKGSIFLKKIDRINVVFYSATPIFYSLKPDEVNYYLTFDPKIKLLVPGGYGYYRVGGLGKLVALEKKPVLFKKVFSLATGSMIDLYFYPSKAQIYYKGEEKAAIFPKLNQIFFYSSNANLLDRFLIFGFFVKSKRYYFKKIDNNYYFSDEQNDKIYDDESFFKANQGLFYKKKYRDLKTNVQIFYQSSYKTAIKISQIIEGEGIRVVDIDKLENQPKNNCLIIENQKNPSLIAQILQQFFNCQFKKEKTEISDIILMLGNLEKDWEI